MVLHRPTLSHFTRKNAMAVGSVYNVDVLPMSHTVVKNTVWVFIY